MRTSPLRLPVLFLLAALSSSVLAATAFAQGPVAHIDAAPNPAACNQSITFDGRGSYHESPFNEIVLYEWDWDYDGRFTPDATGEMEKHDYASFGSYTVALRVTDDNVPAQTNLATVVIYVDQGNQPPVADANGPYWLDVGDDLVLDGSGSSDPDVGCGDSIQSWAWDLDDDGQFDDAMGATPTVPWATIVSLGLSGEMLPIYVRVTDTFGASSTDGSMLSIYDNAPVARITADPNPAACGQPIQFDGRSSSHGHPGHSIVLWEWDFDYAPGNFTVDATGSTASHAYPQFGQYTAALRVTDDNGPPRTDLATVLVRVDQGNQPPVADANGPYWLDEGDDLVLDGSGSSDPDAGCGDSIQSWAWDLDDDGQFDDASGATPTVTWATIVSLGLSGQMLPVTLRVTDTFGASSVDGTTLSIYGNAPVARITASPNPAACGQWVSFDGSASDHGHPGHSIVLWEWDFDYAPGNFTVDATGSTASHAYPQFGQYTAALRVTDDNLPPRTDLVTAVIHVDQGNNPPVADANGPYWLDVGDDLVLDGSGSSDPDEGCGDAIQSWAWDLDNDGQFDDASGATPTVTWATIVALGLSGQMLPVTLRATDTFGASTTDGTTLSIYDNAPVARMTVDPNPAACGQWIQFDGRGSSHGHPGHSIVQFEWDFDYAPGNFTVDAVGALSIHGYPLFGTYTAALRVTDDNLPPRTDLVTAVIHVDQGNNPPVADANGPYTLDWENDLVLDGSGSSDPDTGCGDSIQSWAWDLDDDGQFDDASGATPTVPWATLAGLGLSVGDHHIRLRVNDTFGASVVDESMLTITDISGVGPGAIPDAFHLHQNVPNPFNPMTTITFDVPGDGGRVSLRIFDVQGRLVRRLVDRMAAPGQDAVAWHGLDDRGLAVSSGVYYVVMKAPDYRKTRKLTLLR